MIESTSADKCIHMHKVLHNQYICCWTYCIRFNELALVKDKDVISCRIFQMYRNSLLKNFAYSFLQNQHKKFKSFC